MLYQTIIYELSFNEFPGEQPRSTSYPGQDHPAPQNPNANVPGTDAPGVNHAFGTNTDGEEQYNNPETGPKRGE